MEADRVFIGHFLSKAKWHAKGKQDGLDWLGLTGPRGGARNLPGVSRGDVP
jgi:hypothetical protein